MTTHRITVDEQDDQGDIAYKAFCDCGWSEDHWHHEDQYPTSSDAILASQAAGAQHIEESTE